MNAKMTDRVMDLVCKSREGAMEVTSILRALNVEGWFSREIISPEDFTVQLIAAGFTVNDGVASL